MKTRSNLAALFSALTLALAGCSQGSSEAELVASAKALLVKKDRKGAIIQLKNALQKNGNSAEARFLLGKALLAGGDPVAAIVELGKAQDLQSPEEQVLPELARAMLLLGQDAALITQFGEAQLKDDEAAADLKTTVAVAYAMKSDLVNARKSAADALRQRPGYLPAVIVHARLNVSEGQFDAALGLLDKVLAAEAGNENAGVFKSEILMQVKNDPDAALASLRSVLQVHPDSIGARAATASILLTQGKLAETKLELEQLKKLAPNHPDTLFLEARTAFSEQNDKLTRETTERILRVMPNNVPVLELAGAAEYRQRSYVQAERLLGRALKLSPQRPMTRLLLAQSFLRSGQPEKSIDTLRPMLDTPKVDGATLSLAGEAYLQMGDNKRSYDAFQQALKLVPRDPHLRTSAALAQLGGGNNSAAIAELESVSRGESGLRADLALVSTRMRDGDFPAALKAIDALDKKRPNEALPRYLRGRVQSLQNNTAAAAKSFEAALALEPKFFPAVASLAAIELAAGKPEAARKRLEAHMEAQPTSYQAMLALAELSTRSGAPAKGATSLLRQAVKINPAESLTHVALVTNLISLGDGKGALLAAQEATATLPSSLEVMDALGRAEMAAGDLQRAISTFKKLTALQPKNAMHEVRLADAYLLAQDRQAADRSLRRAVELQPELLQAQRHLMMLALLDKRPQDALATARKLQQRSPKIAAGYTLEGDVETHRKDWPAAAVAYRAALQREKLSEVAIKLHVALLAANKGSEADRMAEDWNKAKPKDSPFLYYLGDVALAQKDFARAEARYRNVLELEPDNALALNNVAWLLVQQGKPGAVPLAERATALLPDRALLLDTLASALEADKQLPRAVEVQKRALALRPKDSALSLRLAKLYIKQGDKKLARVELDALAQLGDKFIGQAEVAALLKSL